MQQAVNADFIKPGVIYGYRTKGDYGEYSEGHQSKSYARCFGLQGDVYYFGRSKRKDMLDFACLGEGTSTPEHEQQCELLKKKCNRSGLNAPSRVLLWVRVCDLETTWDEVRRALRTPYFPFNHDRASEPEPPATITHHPVLGAKFYTVEGIGPYDFGIWMRAVVDQILKTPTRVADSFRAAAAVRVFRIVIEV